MHVIVTAMDLSGGGSDIDWTVCSCNAGAPSTPFADPGSPGSVAAGQDVPLASTEQNSPEAALERVVILAETVERIAPILSPRSSIIISDEGVSSETGRHTDFVVLLSGEPQGGIATRRRSGGGYGGYRHHDRYWEQPYR